MNYEEIEPDEEWLADEFLAYVARGGLLPYDKWLDRHIHDLRFEFVRDMNAEGADMRHEG